MKPKPSKNNEFAVQKKQISKRLEHIKDALGYKFDKDFAEALNLTKGTYSTIMNGLSALSFRTIMKLAKKQVNFNYIFYGVKTRHGGLLIPLSSIKTAMVEENEGVYIERIALLEQENASLKKEVQRMENTIRDKETIIDMLNRQK